jgi:hypothetical protein
MLVSGLAYSTLKMESICSSEMSVDFQPTTGRYIPEDGTLQKLATFIYVGEETNRITKLLKNAKPRRTFWAERCN